MKWYIYVFSILLIKTVYNTTRYLQCKYYLNAYKIWINNPNWDFVQSRAKVKSLILGAGISDSYLPNAEPIGYGYVSTASVSVLNNFPKNRKDFALVTASMFHEAIGTYKGRIFETFSPIYWLDFVLFLPKKVLTFIGLDSKNIIIRIFLVLWWFISAAFTLLLAVYQSEISIFIKNLINVYIGK